MLLKNFYTILCYHKNSINTSGIIFEIFDCLTVTNKRIEFSYFLTLTFYTSPTFNRRNVDLLPRERYRRCKDLT